MNTFTPDPPENINDDQLELLSLALAMVSASPDGTGQVIITIDHGRIQYIQPQPSLKVNERAAVWLRRSNPLA